MPNWCSNRIEITAPTKEILEKAKALVFTDETHDKDGSSLEIIDFNLLIPMPDSFPEESNNSGYTMPGWYDWSVTNWGTKWNASDVSEPVEQGNSLSVFFETAWSPPSPWVQALAEAVPELEVTHLYYESGIGFSGKNVYVDGICVEGESMDEIGLDIWLEFGNDEDSFVEYFFEYSLEAIQQFLAEEQMTPALAVAVLNRYEDEEAEFDSLKGDIPLEELGVILAALRKLAEEHHSSLTLTKSDQESA